MRDWKSLLTPTIVAASACAISTVLIWYFRSHEPAQRRIQSVIPILNLIETHDIRDVQQYARHVGYLVGVHATLTGVDCRSLQRPLNQHETEWAVENPRTLEDVVTHFRMLCRATEKYQERHPHQRQP